MKAKIIAFILGSLAALLLLEVCVRVTRIARTSVIRMRNVPAPHGGGTCTILCLGESMTSGAYPKFLEAALNARSAVRFKVIDGGRISTNSSFILSRLPADLDTYKPDIVIVMTGVNDLPHEYYLVPKDRVGPTPLNSGLKVLQLWNLLKNALTIKAQKGTFIAFDAGEAAEIGGYAGSVMPRAQEKSGTDYFWLPEQSLREILRNDPGNDQARVCLALSRLRANDPAGARELADQVYRKDPADPSVCRLLARVYTMLPSREPLLSGQHARITPRVEGILKNAIQRNPRSLQLYMDLGEDYTAAGRDDEAEAVYLQALAVDDSVHFIQHRLGMLYSRKGEYDKAERCFQEAIGSNLSLDRLYGALALNCLRANRHALAGKYFAKADDLRLRYVNPGTFRDYRRIADILRARGILMVAMQYPMQSVRPLKKMLRGYDGIIFVDNERVFKEAVFRDGYSPYFMDEFGGDFGHCTHRGNMLLAEHLAETLLSEAWPAPAARNPSAAAAPLRASTQDR